MIAAIRSIHTAQTQYDSEFNRYATSLTELGPPESGTASISAADLIANDLANGRKHGYIFAVAGKQDGYIVSAVPEGLNNSTSTFYSDQTMVVHQHSGPEPATAQDPESK
ncbi:MAG TPA: hypothetical protein VMU69_32830 [Bradyrhizobium sp.]|nr:hypothetical protein [Bradyrhizobium sp.]